MVVQDTKAIVFDCFGVLHIDSKQSIMELAPAGKLQEIDDLFKSNDYGFFGKQDYTSRLAELLGRSEDEVLEYIRHEHTLNHELVSFIREHIRPHYRVGLLSNIGREWIDDFFSRHQLHDLFDEVVLSGEEGMVKPNPEIYQLMLARLGVDAWQSIMIDDNTSNCVGAEQVGMSAIQFTTNRQLYSDLATRGVPEY